jgi:hypothetical protein
MKIEITYPPKNAREFQRQDLIDLAKWPFLFTAYICPILNIVLGGPAWSVVVVWSLRMIWSFTFSPGLVEINRISLFVKFVTNASILLIMIDVLLSPGWAVLVVPIVCFSGLAVAGTLFFTDIDRQKQNMMPMLMLIIISFFASIPGIIIWRQHDGLWALVVMGAFALALLVAGAKVLGNDFIREIKRRFHTR